MTGGIVSPVIIVPLLTNPGQDAPMETIRESVRAASPRRT
jgi:hypothetical protein